MEHRYGTRASVPSEVALHCRGVGPLRGRIRDLGLGGMFVELGKGLPLNAQVHLSFTVPGLGGAGPCEADAMVVRLERGGCGLMFTDLDPSLRDVLRAAVGGGRARRR